MSIFEEFGDRFDSIHERVSRYFQGKANDPGKGDAADMMQELLMRIYQKQKRDGLEIDRLEHWVFKVAHNMLLDQQTKSKKHETMFVSIENLEIGKIECYNLPASEVENELETKQCKEELYGYLRQLPDANKIPIVLHYFYGYSYAEIAEELRISPDTVRSRSSRGIKKLREQMSKEKL